MFERIDALYANKKEWQSKVALDCAAKIKMIRGEIKYHGKYHRDIWLE